MDENLIDIRRKKEKLLKEMLFVPQMPRDLIHLRNTSELGNLATKYPNTVIIIDCSAVWCGPCQWFSPIFEKLQTELGNDFIFANVDVDEARDIAMQFGIAVVPTTVFLKGGKMINQLKGALPYEKMKELLLRFKS